MIAATLGLHGGSPPTLAFRGIKDIFLKLVSNPHIAELLRFIFLGTVVELSKIVGLKIVSFVKHFLIVKATFRSNDFAYDWVKRYLEDLRVWDQSRAFHVSACNPSLQTHAHNFIDEKGNEISEDGRPSPVYQPSPNEPEIFQWRGHWITVDLDQGMPTGDADNESSNILTLSVWSRNRKALDDFVQEARNHFLQSSAPPRRVSELPDKSGALVTVRFAKGDISYDWITTFLRSRDSFESLTDFQATTKPSELIHIHQEGQQSIVAFKPAPEASQRLRWRDEWLQVDFEPNGGYNRDNNCYCECIIVTVHNSKRSVLQELVEAAREEYLESTTSKVTVHLASTAGIWKNKVTKNRRSLNSVILPEGMKESLLKDARDFLDSEEWYKWAGVPHRRGYLLYGHPGTGKSTTIHALAGELGLEIYYIQLSSQGMNDMSLAQLISETPAHCIILLEDLDCAFPPREEEDIEEEQAYQNGMMHPPMFSMITLSGLLNVLDSVASEEGRIVFATTNHIDRLDPALVRAGRMDVKVEYKLASRMQIMKTFLRFYERSLSLNLRKSGHSVSLDKGEEVELLDDEVYAMAEKFADIVPEDTFSLAQVQGFLLKKKHDLRCAIGDAQGWVQAELTEKRRMEEAKEKRRNAKAKKFIGIGTPTSLMVNEFQTEGRVDDQMKSDETQAVRDDFALP